MAGGPLPVTKQGIVAIFTPKGEPTSVAAGGDMPASDLVGFRVNVDTTYKINGGTGLHTLKAGIPEGVHPETTTITFTDAVVVSKMPYV